MRLRNYVSFFNYGIRNGQIKVFSFLLNLFILIIALADIQTIYQRHSLLLILILFFLNIVWQFVSTFSSIIRYFKCVSLQEERLKITSELINISDKERSLGFEKIIVDQNIVIMSGSINAFCQSHAEPGCRVEDDQRKRVQEHIKSNFQTLFLFLKYRFQLSKVKGTIFNNQRKLCLADDIEPGIPVAFCKGSYYNTHVTNVSYFSYLCTTEGQEIYSPFFAQNEYKIPSIGASIMGNQIGLSTIAITTDGYIVFLWQQIISNASPGLLVPTGSGSADWRDHCPDGFFPTIITAVNRELYEEIGRPKHFNKRSIAKTRIVGFFRWLNMAGKPEFICLSRLNIALNQIRPLRKEQLPKIMSEYVCDFNNRKINYDSLHAFLNLAMSNDKCSLQLYLNSRILMDYFTHRREDFETFLFDEEM